MERHGASVQPAGAGHHDQTHENGQQGLADAVEGVLGAAGAGGQAAHAIAFGAVQQHTDDQQDTAEHPEPGGCGSKHGDSGNKLGEP